jgi:membrane protein implicated in regulation of membrane protease activity
VSEQVGKLLLAAGAVLIVLGGIVLLAGRMGIGRLPGDLLWQGENWSVYVPLGWMVLLSVVLTILLNVFLRR